MSDPTGKINMNDGFGRPFEVLVVLQIAIGGLAAKKLWQCQSRPCESAYRKKTSATEPFEVPGITILRHDEISTRNRLKRSSTFSQ